MKYTDEKRHSLNDPPPEREPDVRGYSAMYGPIYHKGGGSYTPRRSHGYSAKYGDLGAFRRIPPSEKQKQPEER